MKYLPTKIREEIYLKTIVRSMTYFILVWGTSSNDIMHTVDTLYSRAAKLIHKIKDANHTNEQVMSKV